MKAILDATASRVVPVSLAAGTTILGMLPLVLTFLQRHGNRSDVWPWLCHRTHPGGSPRSLRHFLPH